MLDLKFIRENPDLVRRGAEKKLAPVDVEAILDLDRRQREELAAVEALRRERNTVSAEINSRQKSGADTGELIGEMRKTAGRIKEIEARRRATAEELQALLDRVPNLPGPGVPDGAGAADNVQVREYGSRPAFAFKPQPHHELAAAAGLVDFQAGARMSGRFFVLYRDWGARLERALINFMLDTHLQQGYREVSPPFVVNRRSMYNTGQLPKLEADMYRVESEDLFLIPTAEVPVTNIHQDEILREEDLPLRYTAYTPCFRLEAGAYGRDTRGLQRLHQFDKVEMVKFCRPADSVRELETLTADAEAILQALGLHYRVMLLCAGDLSFAGARCYDLEAWAPAQEKYLEVSSCSNFESFQARRAGIRYRTADGAIEHVHTLNGSGLALPRTMAALLETGQQPDGSIAVPEVLRPYLGGLSSIPAGR